MLRPVADLPVEIIRSRQNARLKDLRQRLLRPEAAGDGLVAIEGEHLLAEALRSGLRIDTIFVREDHTAKRNYPKAGNALTWTVAADAFNRACATEAPQGVAALVEMPNWSFDSILQAANPRLVVLAGLQDPGNVGTILRTAEALGATGILRTAASVHPWNQKVLRASAGSVFRLPVVTLKDPAMLQRLREQGIPLYAASAHEGVSVVEHDLRGPLAFVIGNEGAGIPAEILELCSSSIHIPCPGPVESLNAGVAAAILLYEASRQRSAASTENKAWETKS